MGWIDYDQHARCCARDDLWGQVRRTVRGQPVPEAQIGMIATAIRTHLRLGPEDDLLDLACGNGALSSRLQPYCAASLGVDISDYLIGVAQERFATPRHGFIVEDVAAFVAGMTEAPWFTKALCYGSLAYLSDTAVATVLRGLRQHFPRVSRVLLGNLPDPDRATAFYGTSALPDLDEPQSDLGVWRSAERVRALAGPGWRVSASIMPAAFFGAHYRYDALLERVP